MGDLGRPCSPNEFSTLYNLKKCFKINILKEIFLIAMCTLIKIFSYSNLTMYIIHKYLKQNEVF